MSVRNDLVYVRHILAAIGRIQSYTENLTEAEFMADTKTQDAVVRQFEIIGEATKNVSAAFRSEHKDIPWSLMAKMRDVLIHHYWEVDLVVLWSTLKQDLPGLLPLLQKLVTTA